MGVDIRTYFLNNKNKKIYLTNKFKESKENFYRLDIVGTLYYSDIIDWLRDKYKIADDNFLKEYSSLKDKFYWFDNSYHEPVIIKLKDLISYKSNPYHPEKQLEKTYGYLWENLKEDYELYEKDLKDILCIIEFI